MTALETLEFCLRQWLVSPQKQSQERSPAYLGLGFPFPLWDSFTNEVEIFFIELLLLLALAAAALLLLTALAVFRVICLFFLILVDDEAFSDLWANAISMAGSAKGARKQLYPSSFLLVLIVLVLFARVI
jgi:hypothetical protein